MSNEQRYVLHSMGPSDLSLFWIISDFSFLSWDTNMTKQLEEVPLDTLLETVLNVREEEMVESEG